MSAIFYQNISIIGIPGLDDWSGGYSSYVIDEETRNLKTRTLIRFGTLLRSTAQEYRYHSENSMTSDTTASSLGHNCTTNGTVEATSTQVSGSTMDLVTFAFAEGSASDYTAPTSAAQINSTITFFMESSGNFEDHLHRETLPTHSFQNIFETTQVLSSTKSPHANTLLSTKQSISFAEKVLTGLDNVEEWQSYAYFG